MNKLKKFLKQAQLSIALSFFVTIVMLFTILVIFLTVVLLSRTGLIQIPDSLPRMVIPLLFLVVISLVIGIIFSILFSHLPLKPIREVIHAAERVAAGDYSVRISIKGNGELQDLAKSFNHMTEELNSVEMLKQDFVNNFSHEFKTPIVSIRGFAKMLKQPNLSPKERQEYLDIIISESERLSELSMNVLNLTKLEQQTILTDCSSVNISEQIRLAYILLCSKWADKNLDFAFDSEEIYVNGNENLLKQIWVNMLDNAMKFAPDRSTVQCNIQMSEDAVRIFFINPGDPIDEETAAHLFDKFYQGDRSHIAIGNGLGLNIARRIAELHEGTVQLISSDSLITFEVILPLKS